MRRLYNLGAVLCCALAAACSVEPIEEEVNYLENEQIEQHEVFITANYSDEGLPETKTVLNAEGKVLWTPSDEIAIMTGDEKAKFTSTNEENARSATFRGVISFIIGEANEDNPDSYIYGLYPYDENATLSDGVINTTIPAVQSGLAGSFSDSLAVAVAKGESFTLPFKNAYSGINFQFSEEGYHTVTLSSNNGEPICGEVMISFGEDGIPVTTVVNGSSSVTLTAPDGGTFETGKRYYILCAPVSVSGGFTLTAIKPGSKAVFNVSSSQTFKRNIFKEVTGYLNERAIIKEYQNVDLGLSVKWATCNLGADAPEELGDYYAWGELEPYYEAGHSQSENPYWKSGKENGYAWPSYIWSDGQSNFSKYVINGSYGTTDNKTTLEYSDDAARASMGGNWRIPTYSDFKELIDNCSKKDTTVNGVRGILFTSRKTGYTDQAVFFPINGKRVAKSIINANGAYAYYWTSSLNTSASAFYVMMYVNFASMEQSGFRHAGMAIRPVLSDDIDVTSILLDNHALDIQVGETSQLHATILPDNATFKDITWLSSDPTIARVNTNGEVIGVSPGAAIIKAYSYGERVFDSCSVSVQHAYVDLGLSVKWGTYNVGALLPGESGDSYAWGEIEPKTNYSWDTYKFWISGTSSGVTMPIDHSTMVFSKYGKVDNRTVLDSGPEGDDVASRTRGGSWRIPTKAEWQELLDNCTYEYISEGGRIGYKFTSNVTGFKDKWIYIGKGAYWCSDLYYWSQENANIINIPSTSTSITISSFDFSERRNGHPIRPIMSNPVTSISINKISITKYIGNYEILTATIEPYNATNKLVTWTSNNENVAIVDSKGVVTAISPGTAIITASADTKTASCVVNVTNVVSEPATVDLGLSVKWSSWNLGADAPNDPGSYYAWGESTPKRADQDSYKFWLSGDWNSSNIMLSKYNFMSSYGPVDRLSILTPDDDVANTILGGGWRMPTATDWAELRDNCTWEWMTLNGTNGYKVTSNKPGYTDNWIFLPASGMIDNRRPWYDEGYYWSSLLDIQSSPRAYYMYLTSSNYYISRGGLIERNAGCSVRPVYAEDKVIATPEQVDLGLSVKWSSFNLGANRAEEFGDYYAWGETETKGYYAQETYKWYDINSREYTKYTGFRYDGDNKTVLEIGIDGDDVASLLLGGGWRMPTKNEFDELVNNCTWEWTTLNGINGYRVTSTIPGYTDKWIFLPATGYYANYDVGYVGAAAFYWSSSLKDNTNIFAQSLYFSSSTIMMYPYDRYLAQSIRPVCE